MPDFYEEGPDEPPVVIIIFAWGLVIFGIASLLYGLYGILRY